MSFKQEVLSAFRKVSPSKIGIEQAGEFQKYLDSQYNLFFHKLKFPPELFKEKRVIDFGCGTGEMDIVMANWGAFVEGFDFNDISINRANELKKNFGFHDSMKFEIGDIDEYPLQSGHYDIVVSYGVIAHVPDQHNMFRRMADTCRKGGFVILGFIEDSGLIQRLMHRAIVLANSDRSDEEIMRIAKSYFPEHIERSVRIGGRTEQSVINDYLVNPHYIGIPIQKVFNWAANYGLEYYSGWPNIEIPFTADSPYFEPISKNSEIYDLFFSLCRLRWLYTLDEDSTVLGNLAKNLPHANEEIESLFVNLNTMLQDWDSSDQILRSIRGDLASIENAISSLMDAVSKSVSSNLISLNRELLKTLEMIALKARENKQFDLGATKERLFRGYNGLGTSYLVFHKS